MIRLPLEPIRHLRPLLAPHKAAVAAFLLLGLAAALLEGVGIGLLIPLLQAQTAETASTPLLEWLDAVTARLPADNRTLALTALILAIIACKALLAYGFTVLVQWIGLRVRLRSREAMFRQLMGLSLAWLERQPGGTLLHTLTAGPRDAAQAVQALLWLLLNVCTIVVFAVLLTSVAWPLTLAALGVLLAVALLVRLATRRVQQLGARGLAAETDLTRRVGEALLGIRTIRAFGREAHERARFGEQSARAQRLAWHSSLLQSLTHPLSEMLGAALVVALVALALQAGIALSVLVAMAFMLYRLQPQLQGANANLAMISALRAPVDATLELMRPDGKPHEPEGGLLPPPLARGIRFEGVSFAYAEREYALHAVDCVLERGRTTALVGRSGAGKSTLASLLCRFYAPTAGRILVEDQDIETLDLAAWRRRIALVSQDVHIFDASIRDNLRYGRPDAGDAELRAAAEQAHADGFIDALPHGYDTRVGERGLRLSGGQRQRIAIARAILRDPEILILDEATNALDAITEMHIQAALEDLSAGRTVLVIAHRLATIEQADRILVLERGRLVEQGDFAGLLAADGPFAALYRGQGAGSRP